MGRIKNVYIYDKKVNKIHTCPVVEWEGKNDLWLIFIFNNQKCQFLNNGVQVRGLDRPLKMVDYDYLVSTKFETLNEVKQHIAKYVYTLSKIFDEVKQFHK